MILSSIWEFTNYTKCTEVQKCILNSEQLWNEIAKIEREKKKKNKQKTLLKVAEYRGSKDPID